jgi:hypothetical protein
MFKNQKKSYGVNSREWLWCEQRIGALKDILVSLYGTTGSIWNRFANVDAFEATVARDIDQNQRYCARVRI